MTLREHGEGAAWMDDYEQQRPTAPMDPHDVGASSPDGAGDHPETARESVDPDAVDAVVPVDLASPGQSAGEPTEPSRRSDRFAVTTFVPPQPEVQFAERVRRTPDERVAAHQKRARTRRRRKIIGWAMLGAGVLILVSTAWVGWRSYQAYSQLTTAAEQVTTLQNQLRDITNIDAAATVATVAALQSDAGSARSAVDDPVFRAATVLPLLGPNLAGIREVTLIVDSLAQDVMPSLVDVAQTLQPGQLAPKDGVIDLAPVERISPLLQNADAAVNAARDQLAGIDRSELVAPVGEAVLKLWGKLDQAAEVTGPGARVARLLPPMLGADSARSYLVAFQNPAELRATGGIFGSYAVITAERGKISIVDQGASSRTLGYFDPPVAQLSENELQLYSQRMAQYPQDVNFTPDFPTAAPLFAEMYRIRTGTTVDGVMAIDPVALAYMLKGSAPIDVGEGVSITSENLVSILLSTAYAKFDEKDQSQRDAFLADATAQVFSTMMSADADAESVLAGLRAAAAERRVLIYSARPEEQADLASTTIAGSLDTATMQPTIGVFMNDGTGAKLGYYLSNEVQVTAGECRLDGRRELTVQVVMNYDAPASGLPSYVTGIGVLGAANTLRTNVLVFAPVGGGVVDAQRDGAREPIALGQDHSRGVGAMTVELAPGTSTTLAFRLLGPVNVDGLSANITPELLLTPGVSPWVTSVDEYWDCRVQSN